MTGRCMSPLNSRYHAEYDAVLEAVVTRLQEVSDLISAVRPVVGGGASRPT